jgi:prophage antirepressor-like protein
MTNQNNELSENPLKIAVFKGSKIRKTLHNNEWWFSVVDVVAALTDSTNPRDYWYKMKIREKDDAGIELSTLCRQLKLSSSDGKKYETDCSNHRNRTEKGCYWF